MMRRDLPFAVIRCFAGSVPMLLGADPRQTPLLPAKAGVNDPPNQSRSYCGLLRLASWTRVKPRGVNADALHRQTVPWNSSHYFALSVPNPYPDQLRNQRLTAHLWHRCA